jgi:hypothetical protein
MNLYGIVIGFCSLVIIGLFHPLVIKGEYYFSKKIWVIFCALGLICIIISFFVKNIYFSCLLGLLGFAFLWSIKELFEQEKRVKKGYFPKRNEHK